MPICPNPIRFASAFSPAPVSIYLPRKLKTARARLHAYRMNRQPMLSRYCHLPGPWKTEHDAVATNDIPDRRRDRHLRGRRGLGFSRGWAHGTGQSPTHCGQLFVGLVWRALLEGKEQEQAGLTGLCDALHAVTQRLNKRHRHTGLFCLECSCCFSVPPLAMFDPP